MVMDLEGEIEVNELNGEIYPKGDSGEVVILETITTNPGTNANVTNSGTKSKAKLTFYIPRGNTGATGNGIQSVAKVSTVGLVDTYRITMTDGTYYDFTVTNADVGSAYTKSETDQLLALKVDKTAISDDYTTTKTDDDKALVTSLWATKTLKAAIDSTTGALANLTTTDKTNLVAAINELVTSIAAKVATTDFNTTVTILTNSINTKTDARYSESTVNGADFTINSPTTLATGTEYKVHFITSSSSNQARLSVDNGTTFYNVNGCTGQAVSDEYLTVMFDGTKFVVMTGLGPVSIDYVAE